MIRDDLQPRIRPSRFEDFYRLNRDDLVRALSITLRDADLAAEAADEAMARAFQRWARLRAYNNPAGWAYRVGFNWAISRLRKRRREVAEVMAEPAVWDPDPFDPLLASGIGALTDHQRAVVVLRYFLNMSLEEIADTLQIRLGTVKSRLHRALIQLRDVLEVSS
ncbi:MAG: sigma-70 family RNA polymerase sigma factor [Acidimicrobiia bacterium]